MAIDVIINFFAGVPDAAAKSRAMAAFKRPVGVISAGMPQVIGAEDKPHKQTWFEHIASSGWPHPLQGLLRKHARELGFDDPSKMRVGRVALVGFSEGCGGVSAMLKSADFGLLDSVIAIDGIHMPPVTTEKEVMAWMGWWLECAGLAAYGVPPDDTRTPRGSRLCVITNSSVGGPVVEWPPKSRKRTSFRSTRYTSSLIAQRVVLSAPYAQKPLPDGVWRTKDRPWTNRGGTIAWPDGSSTSFPTREYAESPSEFYYGVGGLWILGYSNLDPSGIGDHRYQASVVQPLVLEKFLADKWNKEEPRSGVVVSF